MSWRYKEAIVTLYLLEPNNYKTFYNFLYNLYIEQQLYSITIGSWTNTLKQRIDDPITAIKRSSLGLKGGLKKQVPERSILGGPKGALWGPKRAYRTLWTRKSRFLGFGVQKKGQKIPRNFAFYPVFLKNGLTPGGPETRILRF